MRKLRKSEPAVNPILRVVSPHLQGIDPNWVGVFSSFQGDKFEVWLNGPKQGDVSLTELVERSVAPCAIQQARGNSVFCLNPNHQVELIIGRTVLHYESTDNGWLLAVDGNELTFGNPCDDKPWTSTRKQLESDLSRFRRNMNDDGPTLEFLFPSYAPFRFTESVYEDMVFATYEQDCKAYAVFRQWYREHEHLEWDERQALRAQLVEAMRAATGM